MTRDTAGTGIARILLSDSVPVSAQGHWYKQQQGEDNRCCLSSYGCLPSHGRRTTSTELSNTSQENVRERLMMGSELRV